MTAGPHFNTRSVLTRVGRWLASRSFDGRAELLLHATIALGGVAGSESRRTCGPSGAGERAQRRPEKSSGSPESGTRRGDGSMRPFPRPWLSKGAGCGAEGSKRATRPVPPSTRGRRRLTGSMARTPDRLDGIADFADSPADRTRFSAARHRRPRRPHGPARARG